MFPNWFEFKVTNEALIKRRLQQIPEKLRKRALHQAIAAGAGVVKRVAISKAPVQTGLMAKSLGVKRIKTRDRYGVSYRVQPRKGFKRPILKYNKVRVSLTKAQARRVMAANANFVQYANPAMYAHLVELGHVLRKRGHTYGRVAGRHWMRSALDSCRAAATAAIADKLGREIDKLG